MIEVFDDDWVGWFLGFRVKKRGMGIFKWEVYY